MHNANVRIMDLKTFLKLASRRERADLAMGCNVPVFILYQMAGYQRPANRQLAIRIERASRAVADRTGSRLAAVPRSRLMQTAHDCRRDEIIEEADSQPDKTVMQQELLLLQGTTQDLPHTESMAEAEAFSPCMQSTRQM